MRGRNGIAQWVVLSSAALLFFGQQASAYVGPGAGTEFIGFFFSLLWWIGTALFSVLLWPIYAFIRRIRGKKPAAVPVEEKPAAEVPSPPSVS